MGLDAVAGLRPGASRAGERTGAARHLHAAPVGAGVVLPGRGVAAVPGCLGALPGADPRGRAPRPDLRLPPAAHLERRGHAAACRPRLVGLGGGHQLPAPGPGLHGFPRGPPVRAGLRAHRVPLLRQRRILRGRGPVAARRPSAQGHSRNDRAWTLRRRVPAGERVGPAQGLAGCDAAHLSRFRAFGLRARDRQRAGRGHDGYR